MNSNIKKTVALILHFRTPDKTIECIKSLINEKLEHIVLIDNSEDQGASLLKIYPYIKSIIKSGVTIMILSTDQNLGFAKAVNKGFNLAKKNGYENLLLINSDAQLTENSLGNMLETLTKCSICAPQVKTIIQNTTFISSLFSFYQPLTGLSFKTKKIGTFKYISGCCLLLKINDFLPPLLDEDFFFYGEDVEFSNKIKFTHQVLECKKSFITHEGSGSAKNGSLFYEYHINRCHLLLASKLAKNNVHFFLMILIRCFTLPARAFIRTIKFKNVTALYGLYLSIHDIFKNCCRSLTPSSK